MPRRTERDLLKAELAKRLQKHLADRGWNQSDLARAASKFLPAGEEFRRGSISCYVNGMQLPRQQHLNAVARALQLDPRDLLPDGETAAVPASVRPVTDEPGMMWLQVDMKVPTKIALEMLTLLDRVKPKAR